jgi:hypothetical protein
LATNTSATASTDDDALSGHTNLSLIHERAEGGGFDGFVEVCIFEHKQRRLTAEFKEHRLEMTSRALGHDATRRASKPVKLMRFTAGWSISASTIARRRRARNW